MSGLSCEQARQSARREISRISTASAAGNRKQTKARVRSYLDKSHVKLDAAFRTLGGKASHGQAADLADRINLFRPCERPVTWWRVPKRTAGYRPVCDLPHELHAAHLIIADALQAQFRPGEHLFGIKGRGRDDLAKSLRAAMQGGQGYTIQGDLRDAFSNIGVEVLYALPLPKTVVQHMLDTRNLRFQHDARREEAKVPNPSHGPLPVRGIHVPTRTRASGPRGIMQGSPASNLLLAWLLNDLPDALPPGCSPYLYADNVLVAARTRAECLEIEPTLKLFFERHRAGPLALDKIAIETIDDLAPCLPPFITRVCSGSGPVGTGLQTRSG